MEEVGHHSLLKARTNSRTVGIRAGMTWWIWAAVLESFTIFHTSLTPGKLPPGIPPASSKAKERAFLTTMSWWTVSDRFLYRLKKMEMREKTYKILKKN